MTELYEATLELSRILQNTIDGSAVSGSITTLEDTARREPEDYFENGTIWFLTGQKAGTSRQILQWVPGTFTFATGAGGIQSGDRYAAASGDYPRWLLIQKINEALQEMVLISEDTTLTTVAYQERYTLPAGVYSVKRVEVADEDSSPYGYVPNLNWQEINGELVFDADHAPILDDQTIRLSYLPRHTEITADTDTIDDQVPLMQLIWRAAALALRWRQGRVRLDDPEQLRQYNDAVINAERKAAMWPMPKVQRDPRLATW